MAAGWSSRCGLCGRLLAVDGKFYFLEKGKGIDYEIVHPLDERVS